MEKKINFYQIIKILLIIFLNIPIKLIKLITFLCRTQSENRILRLYLTAYSEIKGCKIEILENEIYLNCNNISKILKTIFPNRLVFDKEKAYKLLLEYRELVHKFNTYDKEHSRDVKLKLMKIRNEDGKEICDFHYGEYDKTKTLHMTSNKPKEIDSNQIFGAPYPSLILKQAKDPTTILTKNVGKVETASKYKIVTDFEANNVKNSFPGYYKTDANLNTRSYDRKMEV